MTIADQSQRDQALDPRRSFIVQAPAGSGKTELLVSRYVKLLERVARPEEILAITFTRKAAAEMRKRVLERLAQGGRPAAEIANRLRIQTIDSLCTALTRRMPVLARFGAQPAIVEDARELYAEAARRTLQDLNPATERLLRHLDNDMAAATSLVADILASRDRWLRKTGAAPTRAELEAALAFERNRLLAKARALYPKSSEALARDVLTKEGEWRKKPAAPAELAAIEGLREALYALCTMPPARYSETQWQALEAILAMLNPAVAQLKVLFGERGQADFTEFAHAALEALGSVHDPSELLLSLDQKIAHILVDEFQDTSDSQWSLLEKLTSGWSAGDGRTLFVVGDPMQSIYRFREAEVGLFLHARREGIGEVRLEPLVLSTNFRSQAKLVEWFNASFRRILPAENDEAAGAVSYSPATAHHPPLEGAPVAWHCHYDREAEAAAVLKIVSESPGRKAILVRNRTHLDHIVPALKAARVPFKAVEIVELGEKQVVQDLYALTRALSHLGDRIAWLSILRAPWCGLTLADLLALVEGSDHPPHHGRSAPKASGGFGLQLGLDFGDEPSWSRSGTRPEDGSGTRSGAKADRDALVWERLQDLSALSADGRRRAARLRDTLAPAIGNRLRGTLREAVEGAWLALGGPACVDDATELEDAEIFLDELERLEEAGAVDLERLAQSLGELYALPDIDAPEDAVEIMTIHKAKGLEFDTVIVPGLDRAPRSGRRPLFAWKALPDELLLLAPIDETGGDDDPIYKYVRALDRDAEDIESGRLFYVAATRAESRLHLLACTKCEDDGSAKAPFRRSLLAKIWWQAAPHFGLAPAHALEDAERAPIPDVLHRLPADFAFPVAPAAVHWRAPDEGREEAEIEFSWVGETARHVGTVVHRWLQRIGDDALRGWDVARVERLKPLFARELERRGVAPAELQRSADLVATALKNAITDERGRWILGAHDDARTELRMRVASGSGSKLLIMDRVFRDQGQLWIVDYKTSRHEGADVEAFLERERQRYEPQLREYGSLISGSAQGLYFPLLRGWRQRVTPP